MLNRWYGAIRLRRRRWTIRNPWQHVGFPRAVRSNTDENVNRVTRGLFRRCPPPRIWARRISKRVEEAVFSPACLPPEGPVDCGTFPRSHREIRRSGADRSGASALPCGVGEGRRPCWCWPRHLTFRHRVDTHVRRVTGRIGLTTQTDPAKIETDLKALYPTKAWTGVSMRFIQFGRDVCDARSPRCEECEMTRDGLCDWPARS